MRFISALLVTLALPLLSGSSPAPILGDLVNNLVTDLSNLIPSLLRAVSIDQLISLETVLEILSRPFDAAHALTDCASHSPISLSKNGLSGTDKRWYQGTNGTWFVPIVIDSRFTTNEKNVILAGMTEIQQKTCMRFYVYSEADIRGYDYVFIQRGSGQGCYSDSIGRAHRGKQTVNLQPMEPSGCIISGIAEHELLHAIGFDHQQCAPGRNNYVTIQYQNIQTAARHNFDEDSATQFTQFGAPYDYGSVMHYGATAFSTNGQKTIVVKQSGAQIGQRNGLSQWDAFKVNKMHGCPA